MYFNLKFISIGLTALFIGLYLQLFGFNPPIIKSTDTVGDIDGFFWPDQKSLTEFDLVDHKDESFGIENLRGSWNFLFFGYTRCPDICPVTMNTMRQTRDKLGDKADAAENINFIFISVDGERDTPEHLNEYIQFFGAEFIGATGSREQVDSLTTQLGVPYTIDEHGPDDKNYLVGHSGAIFLISPRATLASVFQPPHTAEDIADRFARILDFMSSRPEMKIFS